MTAPKRRWTFSLRALFVLMCVASAVGMTYAAVLWTGAMIRNHEVRTGQTRDKRVRFINTLTGHDRLLCGLHTLLGHYRLLLSQRNRGREPSPPPLPQCGHELKTCNFSVQLV
jgi:hypothetical protein